VTAALAPNVQEPPRAAVRGFGGALPAALEDVLAGQRSACFFGVDEDLDRAFGRTNPGAARFVRTSSARLAPLCDRLAEPIFRDIGILQGRPETVRRDAQSLAGLLSSSGHVPIGIGCDHSLSFWLASGIPSPFTYVYLDAHFDLGLHDETCASRERVHNGNFVVALRSLETVARVVNVGARAWSGHHACYDSLQIERWAPDTHAIEQLAGTLRGRVYVSLDVDVLDPAFVPNTGCPEPFGLTPRELLHVMSTLGRRCDVVGVDVSELRADPERTYTAEIAMRAVYALLCPTLPYRERMAP
jgi:arginase family enzyme